MSPKTLAALNRLYVLHHRSLPTYFAYARPWFLRGDEAASEALDQIAAEHRHTADRLAELLLETQGDLDQGAFPTAYTGLHDVGYDYALRQMIAGQQRDIAAIQRCVADLRSDPLAQALAEQALGAAKGHLETLEELAAKSAPA